MTVPASASPASESTRPDAAHPHAFSAEASARVEGLRPAPAHAWPGVETERFELVSRGDWVPGLLARPRRTPGGGEAARPALLLAVHDAGASAAAPALQAIAGWVGPALALVAIDLPLHGHRASPKLSERLIGALARRARGEALDRNGTLLVEEFGRQATIDLTRTLDALLALEAFDPKRVGYLGLGLGAALGRTLLARDARPCAAVLIESPAAPAPSPAAGAEIVSLEARPDDAEALARARTRLASRLGF